MKNYFKIPYFLLTMLFFLPGVTFAQNNLRVVIHNVTTNKGRIEIGLFNKPEGFLVKGKELQQVKVTVSDDNTVSYTFKDLPSGQYAISLFQDYNDNGDCDRNFFGLPVEPYGFSNNYHPLLKAPSFSDCRFLLNADKTISINLIK